jgi:hypothetical protein
MSENNKQMKIFGPKGDELRGEQMILQNKETNSESSSPTTVSRDSKTGLRAGRSDVRGSIPGEGWEFFSSTSCSDQLWSTPPPASYPSLSVGVKWPGREAEHSPPSSAEVKQCVELYLHSPSTSSWRGA